MQFRIKPYLFAALGLATMLTAASASWAAVVIEGTRIIYPAKTREITVRMINKGDKPVLMQTWADTGNEKSQPDTADAPFIITPPIFRLDPQKGQSVRIVFTGSELPADRESLFWFNTLEVPAMPDAATPAYMQIAIRSRLKLFYRPASLEGGSQDAAEKITWSMARDKSGPALRGDNPTPFHISLGKVRLNNGGSIHEADVGMIPPFGSALFGLKTAPRPAPAAKVDFGWISDFGGMVEKSSPLQP
jgi:chaperone protein EcpD